MFFKFSKYTRSLKLCGFYFIKHFLITILHHFDMFQIYIYVRNTFILYVRLAFFVRFIHMPFPVERIYRIKREPSVLYNRIKSSKRPRD